MSLHYALRIHLRSNNSSFLHTLPKRMYSEQETWRSSMKTSSNTKTLTCITKININCWRQPFITIWRHNVTIFRHSACRFRACFLNSAYCSHFAQCLMICCSRIFNDYVSPHELRRHIVFSFVVCLSVCQSVCLSVCLSVTLSCLLYIFWTPGGIYK